MPVQSNLRRCGSRIHPGGVTNCSMENSMGGVPRDPVRPHDGALLVAQKRKAREEKKRRKKRAVKVSPTIEFDEEMGISWDCHRNSSSDSSHVDPRMRSVGSQELMGLWV